MHPVKHLRVVLKHKVQVGKNCWKVGLYRQAWTHDLSKFSFAEFIPGARYFEGHRSPIAREREEQGLSLAWLHHKGRNKHHFEYWMDYDLKSQSYLPCPMPLPYLAESICDRIGASKTYLGASYCADDPLLYFERECKQGLLHPDTSRLLRYYLTYLAMEGEEACFRILKEDLRIARGACRRGETACWCKPCLGQNIPCRLEGFLV